MLAACAQPGASVAAVAREYDLNKNVVHYWQRVAATAPRHVDGFVPIPLSPSTSDVRIELQSTAGVVTITWPLSAAAQCGAWLRELLR